MLHGILALAASGQQVLLRTHRAWMPGDAKARPYDGAVSEFHSIAFMFFAMPTVLVPSSLLLEFLKVCATYRSCHPSTWSDGCCSLLAAFSDWSVWVSLVVAGSSRFLANYVGNPRIGSCVCRTVDHGTNFPRPIDLQDFQICLDCQMMHDDPERMSRDHWIIRSLAMTESILLHSGPSEGHAPVHQLTPHNKTQHNQQHNQNNQQKNNQIASKIIYQTTKTKIFNKQITKSYEQTIQPQYSTKKPENESNNNKNVNQNNQRKTIKQKNQPHIRPR